MAVAPPDRRRLAATYGTLVASDVVAKALGVAAYAVLGRRLGADGAGAYGALESALASVFVASLLVEGGLAPFGARAVAARPEDAPRLLARLGLLRVLWAVAAVAGLGAYVAVAKPPPLVAALIGWSLLALFPAAGACEWFFQGRNEPACVAAPAFLRNLFLCVAAAAAVRSAETLWIAPCADAAGYAAGVLVQRVVARRRAGPADFAALLGGAAAAARASLPLLVSTLAWAARIFGPTAVAGAALVGAERDALGAAHRLYVSAHALVVLYFMNLLPTWTRAFGAGGAAGLRAAVLPPLRRSLGGALVVGAALMVPGVCSAARGLAEGVVGVVYGAGVVRDVAATPLLVFGAALVAALVGGHVRYAFLAAGRPRRDLVANAAGAAAVALVLVDARAAGTLAPGVVATAVLAGEAAATVAALLAAARRDGADRTDPAA